jgi:hypothetical protein
MGEIFLAKLTQVRACHRRHPRKLHAGVPRPADTFPLGTYVTATSALALHTGSDPFRVYAAALFGVATTTS